MEMNSKVMLTREINATNLSGERVMVDFEAGKYYLLKGVGNDIWEMIQQEMTVGQMVEKILGEYEVEKDVCTKAIIEFLNNLKSTGLISLARG